MTKAPMHVDLIDLNNRNRWERYDRLFDYCPRAFIQQSSWWADAIAPLGPDRPMFLLCRDGDRDIAGLPLYLFEAESGNILTSVPQPGPLGGVFCLPGLTEEQIDDAYRLLIGKALEIAETHHCITFSVITNPFDNDIDRYDRYLEPSYWFENFTQHLAPTNPSGISHGHRNNLNRAKREGLTMETASTIDELKAFYEVHAARHTEIGAAPLEWTLFENLFAQLLPKGKAQLILVKKNGEIASGGFYVRHREVADVFMISMNGEFSRCSPNFLNTAASLYWAAENGITTYNWQSAPNRSSGVYAYKQQWGSVEAPYYILTKRFCPEERLRSMGLEQIRREYPWHYVAPFGLFSVAPGTKRFAKA